MIDRLIDRLQQAGLELTYEEIADALWLAERIDVVAEVAQSQPKTTETSGAKVRFEDSDPIDTADAEPLSLPVFAADSLDQPDEEVDIHETSGLPFQAPAATALPNAIDLSRALRPLMRKVPSLTRYELDEDATVEQIAAQRIRVPVVKPELERWLDLELVIEESAMSFVWRKTVEEFQKKVLERLGAFRNLRTWRLQASSQGELELWPYIPGQVISEKNDSAGKSLKPSTQSSSEKYSVKPRSLRELMHPSGRRLILLVSDCLSPLWQQRPQPQLSRTLKESLTIYEWLERLSHQGPTTVVQLLPERLWEQTELGCGDPVQLSALLPGVTNTQLVIDGLVGWETDDEVGEYMPSKPLSLPVVTLESAPMHQWAKVISGVGNMRTPGVWFDVGLLHQYPFSGVSSISNLSAETRVNRFFGSLASPVAKQLARYMAAAPVSLSVVNLIQEKLCQKAISVHVAEVFMSGLLDKKSGTNSQGEPVYDFDPDVRRLIVKASDPDMTFEVFTKLSEKIADEIGISLKSFDALLSPEPEWLEASGMVAPFAAVTLDVLKAMGGAYRTLAETVEVEQIIKQRQRRAQKTTVVPLPAFQTLEFVTAQIVDADAVPEEIGVDESWPELQQEMVTVAEIRLEPGGQSAAESEGPELETFEFRTGRLEKRQGGNLLTRLLPGRRSVEWVVTRQRRQGRQWVEPLADGLTLEMVALPDGRFRMGSSRGETDRKSDEGPQHEVTVPEFWLGKYAVTQAQWRFVAGLPQVNGEMPLDPSRFKGDNRPVEQVSWYEAEEFCARLSVYTGRNYRLPSEAEWEYACRARTETPFHFGETLTTDIANYHGQDQTIGGTRYSGSYGDGPKGKYRQQTTPVGSFEVANDFGLYDMHGNVWEWCADHWHGNYDQAPIDGSPWLTEDSGAARVLRGGSWFYYPWLCRSASRYGGQPGDRDNDIGFRVSCSPPGSLQ
ncbi:formylglycine-generating enzyme family protein [Leptothoe sp. PORK10 BA2]|uniref:formylglycine-generating enzyme family protein n=1 Tax=Leptothoe sp. PORK10 BA2 TaxID=3110254 RepID=UPI002B2001DF|nr:formylglycine-generating enzyme family protein [Leptothoe sp. PORK10 BA2]MEA5464603.1 formylglycine-generating enzyme family protein [Leptothoe sp. PORK10 BA2]